jgi:hypothetical protein
MAGRKCFGLATRREIVERYQNGESTPILAAHYRCKPLDISAILKAEGCLIRTQKQQAALQEREDKHCYKPPAEAIEAAKLEIRATWGTWDERNWDE